MSADSVPSSKTNIFQSKLIYFRTYSRCAMFDWSDTVFRRRNVTRGRISNTVLQQRYWGREADSHEVCRLCLYQVRVITVFIVFRLLTDFVCLYNNEFWLSLCKIVRSSVILLLPLLNKWCWTWTVLCRPAAWVATGKYCAVALLRIVDMVALHEQNLW